MDENTNVVPMEQKQLPAVAESPYDFMPKNNGEAMELARMLAESTMVPKDYLGKPGNVYVAMTMGFELGLKPVQSLQSIAVINGKPGLYGDGGKALLLKHGCTIVEMDTAAVERAGYAQCTIGRPGRPPVTRTFSKQDAVRAKLWDKEGPWRSYPFRQMAWRAFWFAARDAAADILRGLPQAEELRDMEVDVTAQGETLPREPIAASANATDKMKQHLAPLPATLTMIAEFEGVQDVAGLDAAYQKATAMRDASIPDKAKIRAAYKVAKDRVFNAGQEAGLHGAEVTEKNASVAETATATATNSVTEKNSAPDPLTDEQIIAGISDAKTKEEAQLFASLHIQPLVPGPRKDTLQAIYRNKVEAME